MTVLEDVREFIKSGAPRAFCDDCMAVAVKITPRQHANHKTRELANVFGFNRRHDACSICKNTKKVISYADRT